MSRLRADALLFIAAIIWGTAFIAQKTGMEGLGPFGFVGVRFALSLLVVLPFALREKGMAFTRNDVLWCIPLSVFFFGGVILQQVGLQTATVTNAGFLTSLYVIFTPFAAWIMFRIRPSKAIVLACGLALAGTFLLSGGALSSFSKGDWYTVACGVSYAVHFVVIGFLVQKLRRPLTLVCVQYAACMVAGMTVAFLGEHIVWTDITGNWVQLLYAGVLSGGIAYTIQGVAQQYAPSSDAAIIVSTEGLFAAIAGVILLGDHLSFMGWVGGALIFVAIIVVEAGAYLVAKRA